MTIVEPVIRRWTREEYYRMGEAGFFEDQRVELIEGEIVQMAPQKDVHAVAIGLAARALAKAFGPQFWIRQQLPVRIGTTSEPEPDLSVVAGEPRDYLGSDHPDTALLLIEVSDTTLAFDRGRKASLYASAGFTDYWIVNLIQRRIEVYRDPVTDPAAPSGYRYRTVTVHESSGSIPPLAAPSTPIAVADLLP
jgi:Uma2 family endonuclease